MGMSQVDEVAVISGTGLHAGGTLEANITKRSTFEAYFWWVIWPCGVHLALHPREPDSIELKEFTFEPSRIGTWWCITLDVIVMILIILV